MRTSSNRAWVTLSWASSQNKELDFYHHITFRMKPSLSLFYLGVGGRENGGKRCKWATVAPCVISFPPFLLFKKKKTSKLHHVLKKPIR